MSDASAGLSGRLRSLHEEPLCKQAQWWKNLARSLDARALRPSNIHLDYDILGRYFDGTTRGIGAILDREAAGRSGLDAEALAAVFVGHFGFLKAKGRRAALEDSHFQGLCEALLDGGAEERTATRSSLLYAVRRLRIGALLDWGVPQDRLYRFHYDDNVIVGSFVPSCWPEQEGADGGRIEPFEDYLLSEPAGWQGRVHWVHAHRPEAALTLALGQLHQLRVHTQGMLCRLQAAQPQLEVAGRSTTGAPCPQWSAVVFPAVQLDEASQASLRGYRRWLALRSREARSRKPLSGKLQLPCVNVGVVHMNLAVLWSSPEDGRVISVSSEPAYLGRWTSAASGPEPAPWAAAGCCRRRRPADDDYKPLPQDEEDPVCSPATPESPSRTISVGEVERELMELAAAEEAEQSASFEQHFQDVLGQLGEENSVLRMGTHLQLAFRIMLNGTAGYLDVVELYKVAISRLQGLLSDRDEPNKAELISKICAAKLELGALLRMVEPFAENVVPDLQAKVMPPDEQQDFSVMRVSSHHLVDVEHNIRQFLQQCRNQIQVCESAIAEYDRVASDKVNKILNFLTIITFLVMPVQVLTGVYGMNFERMPELQWHYGYHYFYGLCIVVTIAFATILMCIYRSVT
mmetsp:Transcript_17646/g.55871  ORF Transcript_17646/g.55871 Transcript_17646/m.55871 type:complete len:632 (-) Transcript_17646:84-1979(-)